MSERTDYKKGTHDDPFWRVEERFFPHEEDDVRAFPKVLKAIADGKTVDIEITSGSIGIQSRGIAHVLDYLVGGKYLGDPILAESENDKDEFVLSETARESARAGVARLYAQRLIILLQEMADCSAETRQAIANEIVSTIRTNQFVEQKCEEAREGDAYIADSDRCLHGPIEERVEHAREWSSKLVANARTMVEYIVAALGKKEGK